MNSNGGLRLGGTRPSLLRKGEAAMSSEYRDAHNQLRQMRKDWAKIVGDSNYELRNRVDKLARDMAQELLRLRGNPQWRAALTSVEVRYQQLAITISQHDLGRE